MTDPKYTEDEADRIINKLKYRIIEDEFMVVLSKAIAEEVDHKFIEELKN